MNQLSFASIRSLQNSIYVKPLTMAFTLNGIQRTWDLLEVHDSVSIIIYNISRNVLILVKQFRPAVYFSSIAPNDRNGNIDISKYPVELGITVELCAGIIDKKLPIEQIAREEVLEECGYEVSVTHLEKVASFRAGVGTIGCIQTTFYCEVTDDMKVTSGGGVGDEAIEVVEMTIPEIKKYLFQESIRSPSSFLFGIYWFLYNKVK